MLLLEFVYIYNLKIRFEMKNFINYISVFFLCLSLFSCKNDFLSEDESLIQFFSNDEIWVSPDKEGKDYVIYISGAGDSGFSYKQGPDWLNLNTHSGQFVNNVATINCSALSQNDFYKTGIYRSFLILSIDGKGLAKIPIAYINEGNPLIETESTIILPFLNQGSFPFVIKNSGDGILLWSIVQKPSWISYYDESSNSKHVIASYSENNLTFSYDIQSLRPNELSGKIVIESNVKNKPQTEIDIKFDLGEPSLLCNNNTINFGQTDIPRTFFIQNQGEGLLVWEIDSCPEWLSISETKGVISPYSSTPLQFTCNRSLLPNGQITHPINLLTNDKENPSYEIIVRAEKHGGFFEDMEE